MQNNDTRDDNSGGEADAAGRADRARGAFDARGKRNRSRPVKIYVWIGVLVLAMVLGVVVIWASVLGQMTQSSSQVDEAKAKADATLDAPASQDDAMKQFKAEKLKQINEAKRKQAEEEERRKAIADAPPPSTAGGTTNGGPKDSPQVSTSEQRKLGGGVMQQAVVNDVSSYASATTGGSNTGTRSAAGNAGTGLVSPEPAVASLGEGGSSSSRGSLSDLSGPGFTPSKATLAPVGKYLLAHGTYARCALYPEIITEHPGVIDCRLTEPLYSADGSTVISEAGDRMTGVQKVKMVAGQARVFTSWTELETASGARAQLASLGAGPMGASGTEAWIDNHYMQRYGGAVMLSFIQDALQAASNSTQSSNSGYTVNNSEQNVQGMAEKALESTINIPPTGYILPGTVITVIVARDIDFSSVFENR